jgi:hypothetical protein
MMMWDNDNTLEEGFLKCGPELDTYNPGYSGGRDQEDRGSKPARANSLRDLISKKTLHKNRAFGVAQSESPEFKPQYHKKKKTKKRES